MYGPVKLRSALPRAWREWGRQRDGELHRAGGRDAGARAFPRAARAEDRVEERTALRRIGDAEQDIGGVVAFLAGDAGGYITGQTVACDGGSFMGL
jgi:hypothetical protein